MNIPAFLDTRIKTQKLAILIFGPNPSAASNPAANFHKLAKKRIEIRDKLRADGHTAEFPEDLLKGANTPPRGQIMAYEEVLVQNHDLVVLLVESSGSNNELGYFAGKTLCAQKTQAFIDENYKGGLADDCCHTMKDLGGKFHYFKFPDDLDLCHLLGKIQKLVKTLQRRKAYI